LSSVEVVQHHEPSTEQVFANAGDFFVSQIPPTWLNGVEPRVVKKVVAGGKEVVLFAVGVDVRQPRNALQKMSFGSRRINVPRSLSEILSGVGIGVNQPREVEFRFGGAFLLGGSFPIYWENSIAKQLTKQAASAEADQGHGGRKKACDPLT